MGGGDHGTASDHRIAWKALGQDGPNGVVTFHKLDNSRTKVMVQVDYEPEGMKESVGSGLGMDSRRVRGDGVVQAVHRVGRHRDRFLARRRRELGTARAGDLCASPARSFRPLVHRKGRNESLGENALAASVTTVGTWRSPGMLRVLHFAPRGRADRCVLARYLRDHHAAGVAGARVAQRVASAVDATPEVTT